MHGSSNRTRSALFFRAYREIYTAELSYSVHSQALATLHRRASAMSHTVKDDAIDPRGEGKEG